MKKILNLLMILVIFIFSACGSDDKDEIPVVNETLPAATKKVSELMALGTSTTAVQITEDIVIQGVIVYDPATKNQTHTLYIQSLDEEKSFKLSVNEDAYFSSLAPGQKVALKAKGLWIGKSYDVVTVGAALDAKYVVSSITNDSLKKVLIAGEKITVTPKVKKIEQLDKSFLGTLITIDSVQFNDASKGKKYFEASGTNSRTIRILTTKSGKTIEVSTYKNATFGESLTTDGSGSVTGILSLLGTTTWQLVLRNTDDVKLTNARFTISQTPTTGAGSKESPFDVPSAIANNSGTGVWVKGYIVGAVSGLNLTGAHFTAPFTSDSTNVLIAASSTETDIKKCLVVQLPAGQVRTTLNLKANSTNFQKEVVVRGGLMAYFGAPGIKDVDAYVFEGKEFIPSTADGFWIEKFATPNSLGKFTQFSITGDQAWAFASYKTDVYAMMTGYVSATKTRVENEDWLVSEKIDLSGKTAVDMLVRYKANYAVNWDFIEMYVSKDYNGTSKPTENGTWTKLDLPKSTSFALTEKTVDLANYVGGNFYVAFKYRSSTTDAMTFELLSVSLKNK